MSDSQTEQLEPILDDVLANDSDIRSGAEDAGLEIDNLREVVLRRKDEVWEACFVEQNAVAKVQKDLELHERVRDIFEMDRAKSRSRAKRASWIALPVGFALSVGGFIVELLTDHYWPWWLFVFGWVILSLGVLAVF